MSAKRVSAMSSEGTKEWLNGGPAEPWLCIEAVVPAGIYPSFDSLAATPVTACFVPKEHGSD